jgi:hypothetical protein
MAISAQDKILYVANKLGLSTLEKYARQLRVLSTTSQLLLP